MIREKIYRSRRNARLSAIDEVPVEELRFVCFTKCNF